jgi:hypothetical protein
MAPLIKKREKSSHLALLPFLKSIKVMVAVKQSSIRSQKRGEIVKNCESLLTTGSSMVLCLSTRGFPSKVLLLSCSRT